ncbi:MAG TPA: 2Fe-2S iron-sulfur cluster-binding protein [Sumerlaeia bacterium]|nr:2Fe-2S iron-sulfur cluster-binding protein [Sumerlaeia bacterium]
MTEGEDTPFTLNGKPAVAHPGETVLSVAKRHGIHIPTLCHHDAVAPYGACRLCVVEVSWGKRSKIVTSCIYMPYENDSVETDSARVRRVRAMVLELLWSRHPEVEALRDLAGEYGVEEPRFGADPSEAPNRCILCGMCVRVCAEVVGQHAIGYARRGSERRISTPYGDAAEECIGCAACVFICPTGALHYEDVGGLRLMKELQTEIPLASCRSCGEPFATEQQIARVQERLNLPKEVAETCPRCRGTQHRRAMEKVLVTKRS